MLTLLRKLESHEEDSCVETGNGIDTMFADGVDGRCFATGRAALAALIRELRLTSADAVLMPAYIAEGVIQPFRSAGVQIAYYRLTSELRPHVDDIKAILGGHPNARLMIVWHPFGFEAPMGELTSIARAHGVDILVDCAHAAFSETREGVPFGEAGEFALFSWNKFVPVPDGAFLKGASKNGTGDERSDAEIGPAAIANYLCHLRTNAELLRCQDPRAAAVLLEKTSQYYDEYYAVIKSDLSPKRPSEVSSRIGRALSLRALSSQRRRNARTLYNAVTNTTLRFVFATCDPGVVPFAVPMVTAASSRDRLLEHAWASGIHLATLVDRWNFIPPGRERHFSTELDFMQSHVLVPVNEFLTEGDMGLIADMLNRFA